MNIQKQTPSGSGQKKRRKYIYFEQLLFLLPTIEERVTSGNVSPPVLSGAEDEDSQINQSEQDVQEIEIRIDAESATSNKAPGAKRQKKGHTLIMKNHCWKY